MSSRCRRWPPGLNSLQMPGPPAARLGRRTALWRPLQGAAAGSRRGRARSSRPGDAVWGPAAPEPEGLSVKMGDRSVHKEITSVAVPIPNVVVHPRFSKVVIGQHELALLWLLCPVNLMTTIQPVCIPKETFQVEDGARCWVTRWSRKEEFGGQLYSYIHQKSEQYIINSERLNQLVQQAMSTNKDVVLKGMLCGYKDAGKDACQGDSGDPWSVHLMKHGSGWGL
uniref:Peptidase S1 domain-containing protein n=1 Tax=Equus caballus TaxID=9796 RepID=A0A9L0RF93_HORSE